MEGNVQYVIPNMLDLISTAPGNTAVEKGEALGLTYTALWQLKGRLKGGKLPRTSTVERMSECVGSNIAKMCVKPGVELGAEYDGASLDYIGTNITHIRALKNMTSQYVCDVSGVTRAGLYRYEQGDYIPGLDILQKIADALQVDIISLLRPRKHSIACVPYAIDNLTARAPKISSEVIKALRDPRADVTFGKLESVAYEAGMSLADVFLWEKAGQIFKSKYVNADASLIQENLLRHRTRKHLSKESLYPIRDWETHSAPPSVKEAQRLAYALGLNILDLLIPHSPLRKFGKRKRYEPKDLGPATPEKEKLTEAKYGQAKAKAIIRSQPLAPLARKTGLAEVTIRRLRNSDMKTYMETTMPVLEKIANIGGYSISELFIKPGVDTTWYKEASLIFFGDNLKALREDAGLSTKAMSKYIGIHTSSYWTYETGQTLPSLERLQHIADCMRVEIGDLFIPPEDLTY